MTIRDIDAFVRSLPDWSLLDGCFGTTRIKPSDIDGWVERGGRSLFLEHKFPNALLGHGQRIGFESLARQGNTVIVYWGENGEVMRMEVFGPGLNHRPPFIASAEDFRRTVGEWFVASTEEKAA